MTIAHIAGRARPSETMRKRIGKLAGPRVALNVEQLVNNADAVDGLATLLDQALVATTARDGRIDLKAVAAHVLAEMRRNQR